MSSRFAEDPRDVESDLISQIEGVFSSANGPADPSAKAWSDALVVSAPIRVIGVLTNDLPMRDGSAKQNESSPFDHAQQVGIVVGPELISC